jgi:hypothetical protein
MGINPSKQAQQSPPSSHDVPYSILFTKSRVKCIVIFIKLMTSLLNICSKMS